MTSPALGIRFDVIMDARGLKALGPEWQALEASSATRNQFFQSYLWNRVWWKHFGRGQEGRLRILVGRRGRELVLVWPLVETRHGPVRILEPSGGLLSCFSDAIVLEAPQRQNWIAQAWAFLTTIGGVDGISMPGVHEDARIAETIARCAGSEIDHTASPFIDVGAFTGFDAYLGERSKQFRKSLRRGRRKLESMGVVEDRVDDDHIEAAEAVETVVRFKRDWIRARGLPAKTVVSPTGAAFLAEYCERIRRQDGREKLRISTLRLDGRVIACGIAFVYGGQQLEYLGGYDHVFGSCGPGAIQLASSIEASFDVGDSACNLMTPATDFKTRWTTTGASVRRYFYARAWHGSLYRSLYLKATRPILKQVYAATVPRLRRRARS